MGKTLRPLGERLQRKMKDKLFPQFIPGKSANLRHCTTASMKPDACFELRRLNKNCYFSFDIYLLKLLKLTFRKSGNVWRACAGKARICFIASE